MGGGGARRTKTRDAQKVEGRNRQPERLKEKRWFLESRLKNVNWTLALPL